MCNGKIGNSRGPASLETSETAAGYIITDRMESSTTEEMQRVKFLCSFGGSILPRPLDGKLRYVGGETRIVSVTRDVSYEDLIRRMRELFEGAWILKYQQPEEDLDALVTVVNDEDVVNMMEEYDKLVEGKDGITRLRIFLFSHPDHDIGSGSLSSPRFDADERESERRYVDALNSVPDVGGIDGGSNRGGGHLGNEQVNYGSVIGMDVHGIQFSNLHQLKIPRVPSYGQRFNDVDGSWSPAAGYSPGHHTPRETREYSASPSSGGRFFGGMEDLSERIGDDYVRHSPAHVFEQQRVGSPFVDNGNVVWFPPGGVVGEKSGFPGNLGHSHGSSYDASNICEHCHMAIQRNQAFAGDMRYQDIRHEHHPPLVDQLGPGVEFGSQFSSSCVECIRERETYLMNQEMKMDHIVYGNDQTEHRNFYNDIHGNDRDWILHNQLSHRPTEMRSNRNVQYAMEGGGMNVPYMLGNSYSGHPMTPSFVSHDDPQYIHPSSELGNEMHHDHHAVGAGSRFHGLPLEDSGIRYGSNTSGFGMDGLYQVPYGSPSVHAVRRTHGPVHIAPIYDTPGVMLQCSGSPSTGSNRVAQDGSPRGHAFSNVGSDNQLQSHWMRNTGSSPQKILPSNGTSNHYIPIPKLNHGALNGPVAHDPSACQPSMAKYAMNGESMTLHAVEGKDLASSSSASNASPKHYSNPIDAIKIEGNNLIDESLRVERDVISAECHESNFTLVKEKSEVVSDSFGLKCTEKKHSLTVTGDSYLSGPSGKVENHIETLNTLPEIIASVKIVELEHAEVAKKEGEVSGINVLAHEKEVSSQHLIPMSDPTKEREDSSYGEHTQISKIEPTTAEEEALSKGLQTIRNDDLEEIRELGTGTYGAVYYGKWKGSDVAIKRIKASCFSGKPSERERLIADFWKEATILSSLHHPNVVSFYGVVRDGPDGSLATVTEFMVNGSLKQFLLKKDRTIDRRKRLMLAMDAAFGMEYLHEKNIVHFDLKCENLLVNMRDPHRPVCKIGDLGLSKVKQRTMVSGGVRGTLPWMAPELLSGKTNMVSDKIDIYSFGIVMWELLTAEDPYTDMNCAAIIGGIVNNTLRPQIPSWCYPEWKSLMENCWASDPGGRPSFSEISQKLRKMAAAINLK